MRTLISILLFPMFACTGYAQAMSYLDFRPFAIAVNPATNKVYATSNVPPKSSLEMFDAATLNRTTVPLPGGAYELALDPAANLIYVPTNGTAGATIAVIDGLTGSILTRIPMPEYIVRVVVDSQAHTIYAALQNQIGVIDARTNLPVYIPIETPPGDVAINPRTHKLYVSSLDVSRVTVIDGATHVASVIPLPVPPSLLPNHGIAVNAVTNKIFVVADRGRQLAVVDGTTERRDDGGSSSHCPSQCCSQRGHRQDLHCQSRTTRVDRG